ncbi:hypothetical protein ACTXJX_08800 [Glutamicibacter ardleyensis]|uniref:hypothetical protein n=1 Tax=Glutamicibacter TaxID=1742989 RepID=UPI001144127C|nr:hypothetical protein [Glutamicibacter sp. BW80]
MSHDEVDLIKWPDSLPESWTLVEVASAEGFDIAFEVFDANQTRGRCDVVLALHSELRDAYPVSAHDRVLSVSPNAVAQSIQLVSEELMRRDPECRRLVIATDESDVAQIARAEAAGYRYVVDVDLYDRAVSLMTAEPAWVLEESRRIDEVPTR